MKEINSKFGSFMACAIEQAKKAFLLCEFPVGAVIVDKSFNVISRNYNQVISLKDPTAHAEILSIRNACFKLDTTYLAGCSIYVTLKPCKMCLNAIYLSRIENIYYGTDSNFKIEKNKINCFEHISQELCKDLLKKFAKLVLREKKTNINKSDLHIH